MVVLAAMKTRLWRRSQRFWHLRQTTEIVDEFQTPYDTRGFVAGVVFSCVPHCSPTVPLSDAEMKTCHLDQMLLMYAEPKTITCPKETPVEAVPLGLPSLGSPSTLTARQAVTGLPTSRIRASPNKNSCLPPEDGVVSADDSRSQRRAVAVGETSFAEVSCDIEPGIDARIFTEFNATKMQQEVSDTYAVHIIAFRGLVAAILICIGAFIGFFVLTKIIGLAYMAVFKRLGALRVNRWVRYKSLPQVNFVLYFVFVPAKRVLFHSRLL
jgi:hypothetical protein